jgi:hypothetical protein
MSGLAGSGLSVATFLLVCLGIVVAWWAWARLEHRAWLRKLPPLEQMRPLLIPVIRFYRELGFFQQHHTLSDAELADRIEIYQRKAFHSSYNPTNDIPDLLLLSYDMERVLWEPLHKSTNWSRKAYITTLQELAKISRGAFLPQAIKEIWGGRRGPIWVDFLLAGESHRLQPLYNESWIDLDILREINRLIGETDYRFEVCDGATLRVDHEGYILALTANEKQRLEQERGWRFMDQSNPL